VDLGVGERMPVDYEKYTRPRLKKIFDLKQRLARYDAENQMDAYRPYDWQLRSHKAGLTHGQVLDMCANQVGKTEGVRFEMAYHATGRYPKWWEGRVFKKPVLIWACGVSNELVRDVLQDKLFGDPATHPDSFGTGSVPKKYLDVSKIVKKPQVPNAFSQVPVKHISGGFSTIILKSYESKKKAFMSKAVDIIVLDEEPPMDIMSSCLVRQVNKQNSLLKMTFTPENGMTEVVSQFMNDIQPGQFLTTATWDDAPHLTPEKKEQILKAIPLWERDMRSKGIPVFGDGLVFPISDDDIAIDAFKIPDHFRRIAGLDIGGWNHPTACTWVAYDEDADIVYITDTYRSDSKLLSSHASSIRQRDNNTLVAYPHDAEKTDRGGEKVAQQYRDEGVNMMHTHFTNPPAEGEMEGKGGNAVAPGLVEMFNRMVTGRLKVFRHLNDWFKEKAMYHTKDGNLVRKNEDIMSASRYAVMSIRHARAKVSFRNNVRVMRGAVDPLDFLMN